jgi:hypothetical protein
MYHSVQLVHQLALVLGVTGALLGVTIHVTKLVHRKMQEARDAALALGEAQANASSDATAKLKAVYQEEAEKRLFLGVQRATTWLLIPIGMIPLAIGALIGGWLVYLWYAA